MNIDMRSFLLFSYDLDFVDRLIVIATCWVWAYFLFGRCFCLDLLFPFLSFVLCSVCLPGNGEEGKEFELLIERK